MNEKSINCPKCQCPHSYPDGALQVCPECFHEWSLTEEKLEDEQRFIDSVGNQLTDGDSITTIRDLKAGGKTIKAGTKAKNIKLLDEPVNGHEISCKVTGHGHVYFTCGVVKKA